MSEHFYPVRRGMFCWKAPILIVLFLLSTILWASIAKAESVHVIHARGTGAFTSEEARTIFTTTNYFWQRDLGRPLEIKSWRSIRNPFQRFHKSLNSRVTLLEMWDAYATRRGLKPMVAIVPPISSDGNWYMAGYAFNRRAAYAAVQPVNQFGLDRRVHSAVALTHEIGHLFGASHDDSLPISMMHSAVIPYSSLEIRFSEKSQKEIGKR